MEAKLLGFHRLIPSLLSPKPLKILDGHMAGDLRFYRQLHTRSHRVLKMKFVDSSRSHFVLSNMLFHSRKRSEWSSNSSDQLRSDYVNVESSPSESLDLEHVRSSSDDGADISNYNVVNNIETSRVRPKYFRNRFLNFVQLSSVLNNATESFFKSEIWRRLFVTTALLVISRVGYFIPLPGFDRRLIPQDYLSFVSGSVGKFCNLEEKLAPFSIPFKLYGVLSSFVVSVD
ncbi:F15k9.21, putative isoform 1 [Hibiscus syriacus]|uniref:F15k9.21, putative isoform 1 n=1 Tax=Hibiscus syriacus TaxID=106335 RepID=A0A6A3C9W8_HIBSY|nr:F15k9.21, putative isoform 1 [Hibiscus syriacus]